MIPIPVRGESKLISIDEILGKIPRPERSGWMSVILSLIIIYTLATTAPPGSSLYSLFCAFLIGCPVGQESRKETNADVYQNYHWINVAESLPTKKGCGCHIDYQYPVDAIKSQQEVPVGWLSLPKLDSNKIYHADDVFILTCNSDIPEGWPTDEENWVERTSVWELRNSAEGSAIDMVEVKSLARLHCVGKDHEKVSKTNDKVPKI